MRFLKTFSLVCFLILCVACKRDHLYYASSDTATVFVDPDWTQSAVSPNGVTIFAFRESDGSLYKRFPTVSARDKSYIKLPQGCFTLVVMNDSPEEFDGRIEFIGEENIGTFQARGVGNGQSMLEPDTLVVSVVRGLHIKPDQIDYYYDMPQTDISEESAIDVKSKPLPVVSKINVDVHVKGLKYARGTSSACIRGLSGGYYMGLGHNALEQVTQDFVFSSRSFDPGSDSDGVIQASFLSFGIAGAAKAGNGYFLDIDFVLINGESYPVSLDVSDMISLDVSLVLSLDLEIELPEVAGEEGGGFSTDINEWDDEIVDIPM